MTNRTWHVEKSVLILMTGGFFIHLINASRYWALGTARVSDVLTWPVDFCLAAVMIFCSVALIARRRAFAQTFHVDSWPRRVGYWAITFYITVSIPGHIQFLFTGNTRYFDVFPWWFSLIIMPVYVLIMAYFITLKPRAGAVAGAPASGGNPEEVAV